MVDAKEDLTMSEAELAELLQELPGILQELEAYSASGVFKN